MRFVVGDACIRLLLRSANHRAVFKLTASRDSHPQFRERVFAVFEGDPPEDNVVSQLHILAFPPHNAFLFSTALPSESDLTALSTGTTNSTYARTPDVLPPGVSRISPSMCCKRSATRRLVLLMLCWKKVRYLIATLLQGTS